jgi:hypothetical protein
MGMKIKDILYVICLFELGDGSIERMNFFGEMNIFLAPTTINIIPFKIGSGMAVNNSVRVGHRIDEPVILFPTNKHPLTYIN